MLTGTKIQISSNKTYNNIKTKENINANNLCKGKYIKECAKHKKITLLSNTKPPKNIPQNLISGDLTGDLAEVV